ncbi:MAG TPA: aspartate ammonia-lyase [Actinomycetales bacterium]|nr:aspartate ammonia-lyase [Actinomycetales bacterium]
MTWPQESPQVLARGDGVLGEVVLRRRGTGRDAVHELIVNGAFLMDTVDVSTERLLADATLDRLEGDHLHVLVGGLGLGYTASSLLASPRVEAVTVVEIEPLLVRWLRDGVAPPPAGLWDDDRLAVCVGDVADVLAACREDRLDAVLLDVDNGPEFLVHDSNARVYGAGVLSTAARAVRAGGVVGVWSSHRSPGLARTLDEAVGPCAEQVLSVQRDGRDLGYAIYLSTVPDFHPDGVARHDGAMNSDFRIEHDTMGEVRVPASALWRAQTQRAVENFPISGGRLERAHIEALARVKKAAARANAELGVLEADLAAAIASAADEVARGLHDEQFPIDVFQTGSGTSSNMNANEVIASLASRALGRDVHPNDHVNASQSSNDVFPTSVHAAATAGVVRDLVPALDHLAAALETAAAANAEVVKSGRTHLMDATPVTLGQELGGYAAQVRRGIERVEAALPRVAEVPLGGTAVGTGINTPAGFPQRVIELLASDADLPLTEARDHFEAQGARDGLVELSGALRVVAVSLTKICNDLRWMGSGPNTGLAEVRLPDLQPGSSIMPGKVNPVVPEAVLMVCAQVVGNDSCVAWAGASGTFELNVMIPVMARNVLESIRLVSNASRLLADRCVAGLEADEERCRRLAEASPSVVTPLNRVIGYEAAAKVAKHAVAEGTTVREAVVALGFVERGEISETQLDDALDVLAMTRPPVA